MSIGCNFEHHKGTGEGVSTFSGVLLRAGLDSLPFRCFQLGLELESPFNYSAPICFGYDGGVHGDLARMGLEGARWVYHFRAG